MNEQIWQILATALIAVGFIEWLKKVWDIKDKKKYALFLPVVCIGAGFAQAIPALFLGLVALACAQLAYPLFVQLPKALIEKITTRE